MFRLLRARNSPFIFTFLSSVWADYYIDDTNTTLTYSSGPKAAWAPYAIGGETLELLLPNGTYQVIDAYVCWNHTYRYAACFDTDSCLLTVPFTGSGITVFVYQAGPVGINASITIDGDYTQTNVLAAPPAPAYEIANVSMFNVQQIPSGSHTLDLLINDLSGSYSGMMFDYAYVNESFVANSTVTTSATSTSSMTSTAASTSVPVTSTSHIDIGAIVGGVIAGVAVIAVAVLALFWMRRRRRHIPEVVDFHSGSPSPLFHPLSAYDPPFTNSAQTYDPYGGYTLRTSNNAGSTLSGSAQLSSETPLVPNRLVSPEGPCMSSSNNRSQDILTPFMAISNGYTNSPDTRDHKAGPTSSNGTANTSLTQFHTGQLPSALRQDTSPMLTDEQADFVNVLHHNNVPAAAIARVMERMLADRHAGIREWERETRLARTNSMTTAPPSYDLVAGAERGTI